MRTEEQVKLKLYELLSDVKMPREIYIFSNLGKLRFVKYLMTNGVTLRDADKWVSVDERLPVEELEQYKATHHGECPEFNVMIKGHKESTTLKFDGEHWYDEYEILYKVTHWMPMPQPPKEVQ